MQPVWASSLSELGRPPPDVYKEYHRFLQGVANWIRGRGNVSARYTRLAINAIREEGKEVFCGVGVYTSSELFFAAGKFIFSSLFPTLKQS